MLTRSRFRRAFVQHGSAEFKLNTMVMAIGRIVMEDKDG